MTKKKAEFVLPLRERYSIARRIWLWLKHNPGEWTVEDIRWKTGYSSTEVSCAGHRMVERGSLRSRSTGKRPKRINYYWVDDACIIPMGTTVEEIYKGETVEPVAKTKERPLHLATGIQPRPGPLFPT